jgi:hypothetical protein
MGYVILVFVLVCVGGGFMLALYQQLREEIAASAACLQPPPEGADVEGLTRWAEAAIGDGHDARIVNMVIRQHIAEARRDWPRCPVVPLRPVTGKATS